MLSNGYESSKQNNNLALSVHCSELFTIIVKNKSILLYLVLLIIIIIITRLFFVLSTKWHLIFILHQHQHRICVLFAWLFFPNATKICLMAIQRNKHSIQAYYNNTEHSSTKCSRCYYWLCPKNTKNYVYIHKKRGLIWEKRGKKHLTNKTVNIHHRWLECYFFLFANI